LKIFEALSRTPRWRRYTRERGGFYGKHIVHVNSTYQGGGVAEILYSLVLLMNDVGIDTGWRILHGSPDFFNITKKFHNALQGDNLNLSDRKKVLYLQVNDHFCAVYAPSPRLRDCSRSSASGVDKVLQETPAVGMAVPHRPDGASQGALGFSEGLFAEVRPDRGVEPEVR